MRRHLWIVALAASLATPACGTSEKSFPKDFSTEVCKKLDECSKGQFDSEWDNVGECVDDYVDYLEDDYEDCDFDQDQGAECLQSMRQSDCDDFVEGDWYRDCSGIYECSRGGRNNNNNNNNNNQPG
jgi:hypothetical protein